MKALTLDLKTFDQILNSYSSLGEVVHLGTDLKFYDCNHWKNSVMSPIFINQSKNYENALLHLDSHFKKTSKKSPYNSSPYFNLLASGKGKLSPAVIRSFRLQVWQLDNVVSSLNLWNYALELKIPKEFHLRVGHYFDPQIYPHFLNAMKTNFKSSDQFMLYLNKMIKGIENETRVVLIFNDRGTCVAAGLVSTKNEGAFIFCGSIHKRYRGRNLWKVLVAARQMISAEQGAKVWITTTRVPQLLWRGDQTFRIHIFKKVV